MRRRTKSPEPFQELSIPACRNPEHVSRGFATTSMIPDARNHCGAILAANLVISLGDSERPQTIARQAYELIGPGPIVRGAKWAARFADLNGLPVKPLPVPTLPAAVRSIEAGRPCALLVLLAANFELHWVLAVGADPNGRKLWVADGWHPRLRVFSNGSGAWFLNGSAFARV